jgi:hypothetical protein
VLLAKAHQAPYNTEVRIVSDHRFGRRWRRAVGRADAQSRHADRHHHTTTHADRLGGSRTDNLAEASHVLRGLR